MKILVDRHGAPYKVGTRARREVSCVRVFRGNGSVSTLPRGELKAIFEALAEDMQCVHGVIALMEGEDATPAS